MLETQLARRGIVGGDIGWGVRSWGGVWGESRLHYPPLQAPSFPPLPQPSRGTQTLSDNNNQGTTTFLAKRSHLTSLLLLASALQLSRLLTWPRKRERESSNFRQFSMSKAGLLCQNGNVSLLNYNPLRNSLLGSSRIGINTKESHHIATGDLTLLFL